jgi:hypothetical protein
MIKKMVYVLKGESWESYDKNSIFINSENEHRE